MFINLKNINIYFEIKFKILISIINGNYIKVVIIKNTELFVFFIPYDVAIMTFINININENI